MRFLKIFFSFVIVGLVGVFGVIYFRTELSVWRAGQAFEADLLKVYRASVERSKRRDCVDMIRAMRASMGGNRAQGEEEEAAVPKETYYLRFVSATEYVGEVDCMYDRIEPMVLLEGSLPLGVRKLAGSGIRIVGSAHSDEISSVVIGKANRYREVGFDEGKIANSTISDLSVWNRETHPVPTTCEGWGHECCDPLLSEGLGERNEQATSCQEYCYAACAARPTVLFFNSDPVLDLSSRSVSLHSARQTVVFGYQIEDADSDKVQVMLDFGDGTMQHNLTMGGRVSHEYRCSVGVCRFIAALTAIDEGGLAMQRTPLAEIMIVMQPRN